VESAELIAVPRPFPNPESLRGGSGMAEPAWMRRQMEQILELDMEELEVEEVDDSGSSSSSDVATFLRSEHTHPSPLFYHFPVLDA
jgi:hypothetical protein